MSKSLAETSPITPKELVLEIVQESDEPLSMETLLSEYRDRGDRPNFPTLELNPTVWQLVGEGLIEFTGDWLLRAT